MKTVTKVAELQSGIEGSKLKPVGFVPTMGALHNGHLSLVRMAVNENPVVVVSIFVNPTQFNDKDDLRSYPRTPEADIKLLSSLLRDNDIIFMPEVCEIYPEEDKRKFSFGNLDNVMEAKQRPGHFNGVAQVVSRLFDIVKPDRAYFGQKDFQQLAVIKAMVRQLKLNISIVPVPIVRETDGLAMSSRNTLLETRIRAEAPVIYRTLERAASMIRDNDIADIRRFVFDSIESHHNFKVEYFDVVDNENIYPVSSKAEMKRTMKYFACIAVKAGRIRLIDNIEFPLV